jgi:NAD+ synthase (glutamine-hydrolysing)
MKTAIAQLNFHVGNLDYNTKKIIDCIVSAENEGADLIVFSELAICGYSPLDMLEHKDFIVRCNQKLNEICKYTKNIGVIVGLPTINENSKAKTCTTLRHFYLM